VPTSKTGKFGLSTTSRTRVPLAGLARETLEPSRFFAFAIERNVIASFQIEQSLGFQGDFRQWGTACGSRPDGSLAFSIAAI